ncbi:MAG: UTP--glucose-1-phosphate uridylyltransferase, partial [Ruminiclostridium sp.]|nr:UTP--glucose-1-phosphate uridylyltransferase [Ruminiclostridium sp.]
MTYEEAKAKMTAIGQEHVFRYYDELSETQKETLLQQVEETDFSVLGRINGNTSDKRGVFSPLAAMQRNEIEAREKELHDAGVKAIKEGKTAALLLAGGMGTRLGSDNPKGMYDIGLTKPVYIFERIISNLLDVVKETDTWIGLFIMTSE